MTLPAFNYAGDLPEGIHRLDLEELVTAFSGPHPQRQEVTNRLRRVFDLARTTGRLERFIIFGSYVTAKPDPRDVDIILIMADDFRVSEIDGEPAKLFEHALADEEFGASVFWVRPSLLILETVDEFIAHWQRKRDGVRRGIIEVSL